MSLPVSFAQALLDGLSPEIRAEIAAEFRKEGLDLGRIFDSLDQLRADAPFEITSGCERVRLWVE